MKTEKFKLGITGGIGCGKSYVAAVFAKYGIPVYDTDSAAKRLMVTDAAIRSGILSLLGEEAYNGNVLNKPLLAQYIFSDNNNAARINAIVHPRVYNDFIRWGEVQSSRIVAMESAILFESGFDKLVDKVLMVSAPFEVRLQRAIKRDKATREQIMSRMNAQLDDAVKLQQSDYVLFNDGEKDVEIQVKELIRKIQL